jgi:hypothetical protein
MSNHISSDEVERADEADKEHRFHPLFPPHRKLNFTSETGRLSLIENRMTPEVGPTSDKLFSTELGRISLR